MAKLLTLQARDGAQDLVSVILPGLQGLPESIEEPLGLRQAMAPLPQPLDQLDLAADPRLTLGNVAVCLGEVFSFSGKVEHGCVGWVAAPSGARPLGSGRPH